MQLFNVKIIIFLKLTFSFQVVLTSMHKYIPKIWIIRCDDHREDNLISQPCKAFSFPETEFIAVTAYQVSQNFKLFIFKPKTLIYTNGSYP